MATDTTTSTGQGSAAYDAANDSPNRRSFVAFPTNSRRELTPQTRREIVKKHRALEANCPFLTRVQEKYARQAVGTGIHFRFETDDLAFNDAARRDVENWWSNPELYSVDASTDGWTAKSLAAKAIIADGEYNAVLIRSDFGPMIQPLDVFEIETPPLRQNETFADWDDGVRIDAYERPIEFAVRTLPRGMGGAAREFRYIPRQDLFHIFKRRRARGHRGMAWGYSGLNQGIDALDLNALITGTAKLHSALAVGVKGTARKGKKGAIGKIGNDVSDPTNTQPLEKVFGSMINYLGENGEIQLLSSQHPQPNQLEFIKLLFHQMCLGYDLPFTVMWSMTEGGGTSVRYDAEDAQSAFDQLGDLITWQFVRREIIWRVASSIKAGRIAAPKDRFWFEKILFRGPRKITVDVGRMASAFKTLTRNAGMSTPRFLEEQGLDADAEMRAHIRFLGRVKKMCEAEGVPFDLVMEPTPGAVTNVNVEQPQN